MGGKLKPTWVCEKEPCKAEPTDENTDQHDEKCEIIKEIKGYICDTYVTLQLNQLLWKPKVDNYDQDVVKEMIKKAAVDEIVEKFRAGDTDDDFNLSVTEFSVDRDETEVDKFNKDNDDKISWHELSMSHIDSYGC